MKMPASPEIPGLGKAKHNENLPAENVSPEVLANSNDESVSRLLSFFAFLVSSSFHFKSRSKASGINRMLTLHLNRIR